MRAGLLSDPRVVVLLRRLFVPVQVAALNTAHCMADPRDAELLRKTVGDEVNRFQGGEREAFVLPDGRMLDVFMSLHGNAGSGDCMSAAGRRSDGVVAQFRHHGAIALRRVAETLPADWQRIWDREDPEVATVAAAAPEFPMPDAGAAAFRVFVRNSHRMYDDLHGCELAPVDAAGLAPLLTALRAPGDRAELSREPFVALANAMLPRGSVDGRLDAASIGGTLRCTVTEVAGNRVRGTLDGRVELRPTRREETSKRESTAALFESCFDLRGRFELTDGRLTSLRAVSVDGQMAWKDSQFWLDEWHAPRHSVGFEWVMGPVAPAK